MSDPAQAIFEATQRGDLSALRKLVDTGMYALDCANEFGDTPLLVAAASGHADVVAYLLDAHVDITRVDTEGNDALITASERPGNAVVIRLLLAHGADIDRRNQLGRTPLIAAAAVGDLPNVVELLRHNPALNAESHDEETALTFAVVNEHPELVRVLVEAGADVHQVDSRGWTALTYARQAGNAEIVDILTATSPPSAP